MYAITHAACSTAIIKYRQVTEHTAMGSSGIEYDSGAFDSNSSSYRHSLRHDFVTTPARVSRGSPYHIDARTLYSQRYPISLGGGGEIPGSYDPISACRPGSLSLREPPGK